jgi:hypothetical protein
MKRLRAAVAATTLTAVVVGTPSRAEAIYYVTTTAVGVATTAGVAILVYFVVFKKDGAPPANGPDVNSPPPPAFSPSSPPPPPPPPASGAWLYLRDTGPQLALDLTSGSGPAVHTIEEALELQAAHRPAFERALRAHRAELLSLADPAQLTPERSVAFLQRVVELAQSNRDLAADVAAWTARMDLRTRS